MPDLDSNGTPHNQAGAVIDLSLDGGGHSTAVLWPAGSATPLVIAPYGKHCAPVDLTDILLVNVQPQNSELRNI
ncbi:MAG: hypothetical protein RMZ43_036015 [Nostoc sp. CmiVER01]|uniref:hypothetical protein n=1 Tax=Nostoc sp. CmiVER01 TaxID=3075384 RepID=UPI003D160D04